MSTSEGTNVAIISNLSTPYRHHLLKRLNDEIKNIKFHNLFTHKRKVNHPWDKIKLEDKLNPVYFGDSMFDEDGNQFWGGYILFKKIRTYLLSNKIKLIILMGYADLTRILLIYWARRMGIPLIIRADSNIFTEARISKLRLLLKQFFIHWLINQSAGLMPMGTCGRAYFRLYNNHNKPTFIVPYEPCYELFLSRNPEVIMNFMIKNKLNPSRQRFIFCGRLVNEKGIDNLIDAFENIIEKRPNWDLILVGTGKLEKEIKSRIQKHMDDRIIMLGFLHSEDMVTCYHCCDVLVLPSIYEPWALVVNEAVASGLAVVSTDVVGAAVELVKDKFNGCLVPPNDIESLAEALISVSDSGTIDQMKSNSLVCLEQWRKQGDPVDGVRSCLHYFKLIE